MMFPTCTGVVRGRGRGMVVVPNFPLFLPLFQKRMNRARIMESDIQYGRPWQ